MRVGSSSDIYDLLAPKAKPKEPGVGTEGQAPPDGRTNSSLGGRETAASFLAHLAKSNFERDDTDGDGFVDQNEYVDAKMKPRADGYVAEEADVRKTWSELDKKGNGRLDEQEYREAFASVLQVSQGTFDKPIR
jgi:hypothetical protein